MVDNDVSQWYVMVNSVLGLRDSQAQQQRILCLFGGVVAHPTARTPPGALLESDWLQPAVDETFEPRSGFPHPAARRVDV